MERRAVFKMLGIAAVAASLPGRALGAQQSGPSPASRVRIQRLSWAGIKLVTGTTTLFVDAVHDPAADGTRDADVPLEAATADRYGLVTHAHGDHCDPRALKAVFTERSRLVCDRETALRLGDREVPLLPVSLYQPEFLPGRSADFCVFPVPAADGLAAPQVSWVIDGGGKRFFHAGDTQWHGHFWNIGRAYGPFDVVFLPVNGFRQTTDRTTRVPAAMSLTPEQAVDVALILGARKAIPIHYGRAEPGYSEVADALNLFLKGARASKLATQVLAPAEVLTLGA
jgi:L-ascorbate metabolism protein UlaG (beta-lactamase superfamily)